MRFQSYVLGLAPMLMLSFVAKTASPARAQGTGAAPSGVAVLLVDTDHGIGTIDDDIYGHFLEHINHSVVDGLFAEQIQGQGFEGRDFATFWQAFGDENRVALADVPFERGTQSIRITAGSPAAGIRQRRLYVQAGQEYNGSAWLKAESGSPRVTFRVLSSAGRVLADIPLRTRGSDWQEVRYSFRSPQTDTAGSVEIAASGSGAVLMDFISLMPAAARASGMMRPDLVAALKALAPPFLRWPGGSYASVYRWKDAIGPHVSRVYHPNVIWGGYSDYYGFGTDEFMELSRQLGTEPLIVLNATTTDPDSVQYALDWVHYLNDPATTEWGKLRAANGHPEPYQVRYFQIDNEAMNHGHSPEEYAAIVNAYGSRLRQIAPGAKIFVVGQKRSTDLIWSQKVIALAGENFDVLGVHNYEYEPDLFETGVRRISDYLVRLRDYIRGSAHPDIEIGVLEWNLSRAYDWRAGLHAAGSLISYEQLGPELTMSCPALLMRNTADDPTWTAFIYHDHVSWFPGAGYVVQKLFRDHYAERYLASTAGTFLDLGQRRSTFFDEISTMKPEDWRPGVDAIATASADGQRVIIKAVNYEGTANTLLTRLQGSKVPANPTVTVHTISAGPNDAASLSEPDRIRPVAQSVPFARDLAIPLPAYSVVVVEVRGN